MTKAYEEKCQKSVMIVQNNRKQELMQRKKLFNKVRDDGLNKSSGIEEIKTKMME